MSFARIVFSLLISGFILVSTRISATTVKCCILGGLVYIFCLAVISSLTGSSERSTFIVGTTIPKIRGKLPGNIDILWKLICNEPHEYCGDTLRIWAEEYGPTYDMNILWGHQIVTVDPANVKHILAQGFESFGKGSKFQRMFDSFLGEGIFTTDGETWKYHRTMARPFFSAERISDFECFERHTLRVLQIMSQYAVTGEPFDIQALKQLYTRFTLDAGTDFLFGSSVDSLIESPKDYETFAEAFNIMSKIVTKRVRIGSNWRFFEIGRDPCKGPMSTIHAFVDPIVQNAICSREKNMHLKERTFLDHLIKSTSETDTRLVRDETLNLLLAARDTTASLLTFLTYILALHPEVSSTLRVEIDTIMGHREYPTLLDIRSMKYLRAVINEVLRLFPPVPFNIRRCTKPSLLPSPLSNLGPLLISPGISVTYSPLLIHRRTDVWGTSACVFDPQRWLHKALMTKTHVADPFAFLPFNAGPRMCIGQQFAYHECSYFIIRMLKTFSSLELAPDAQPSISRPPRAWSDSHVEREGTERCWPQASLTLFSKGGLWIRTKNTVATLL